MKIFIDIALEVGKKLIESGAEIQRAEDSVKRICKSSGAKNVSVFSIPSFILVSATTKDGEFVIRSKRIYFRELNLGKIDRYNALSRSICNKNDTCKWDNYYYNFFELTISVIFATGAFCIYFGGTFYDALFAGIAGIIITLFEKIKPKKLNVILSSFVDTFIAGTFAVLMIKLGASCNADKVIIGAIMLLIPGMSISNSIKDIILGDTIAGILTMIEAVFIALAIVLGFALSVILFGG